MRLLAASLTLLLASPVSALGADSGQVRSYEGKLQVVPGKAYLILNPGTESDVYIPLKGPISPKHLSYRDLNVKARVRIHGDCLTCASELVSIDGVLHPLDRPRFYREAQ